MKEFLSKNRDPIIVGFVTNGIIAVIVFIADSKMELPSVEVPIWMMVFFICLLVPFLIINRKRKEYIPLSNRRFEHEKFSIDGKRFIQCSFIGTQLIFSAKDGFAFDRNEFSEIRVKFTGPAGNAINALTSMYQDPAFRPTVEGVIEKIKNSNKTVV